jgi:hypothetical protein
VALLAKDIYHMGPLLRLQWQADGETEEQKKGRGSLWLERAVVDRLRTSLVPMNRPEGASHVHPSQCWVWTGPVDGEGKGIVYNQDRGWMAHRLLYVIQFGPITERTLLYSTCGVARCCNPHHYTAVDRGPVKRQAMGFTQTQHPRCRYGHAMTPENTYVFQGKPMCRDCRAAAQQRYRQRHQGAGGARPSWG